MLRSTDNFNPPSQQRNFRFWHLAVICPLPWHPPQKGHKQTSRDVRVTSAVPPIADFRRISWHNGFVPKTDTVCTVSPVLQ